MDKEIKLRCPYCNQTLGYGKPGTEIELKCPRRKCKKILRIIIRSDESVMYTCKREVT